MPDLVPTLGNEVPGEMAGRVVALGVGVGDREDPESEPARPSQVVSARGGGVRMRFGHGTLPPPFLFRMTRTGPREVCG